MRHRKLDFASLRERTTPLDDGVAQAIHGAVKARQLRVAARLRAVRVAVGLAVIASIGLLVLRRRPAPLASMPVPAAASSARVGSATPPPRVAAASEDYGGLVMADGSRVTFLVAGTQLTQSGSKGRQSTLVRGAARFDVVHDPETPFRVTAGSVVIEDVGTVFVVRLADDGRTDVSVESGSVSVRGTGGATTLGAGMSEVFPLAVQSPSHVSSSPPTPAPAAPPQAPSRQVPSWKRLALAGDYDHAYALIQDPGTHVHDEPEDLLLAADAARLSGHADRAVFLLRQLLSEFPSDAQAGLAALTLGRVLADDLGQPREAASAFATAYERGGPLAEDALAREVEAWATAGDRAAAKNAALRYLTAYPTGRRARDVRRFANEP